jgi:hypothetical protein
MRSDEPPDPMLHPAPSAAAPAADAPAAPMKRRRVRLVVLRGGSTGDGAR